MSGSWSQARDTIPSLLSCSCSQDEPPAMTGPLSSKDRPRDSPTQCPGSGTQRGFLSHSVCRRLCRSSHRCWTCHCCTCGGPLKGNKPVSLLVCLPPRGAVESAAQVTSPIWPMAVTYAHTLRTPDHGLYIQSLGLGLTGCPALSLFYP